MATPDEIIAVICPTLLTTPGYEVYIDMATTQTSQGFFGTQYERAIALRAAHMFMLDKRGADSGVITYKMEGRLAVSYGGTGVIRDELALTNYGMQLLKLIQKCTAPVSSTSSYAQTLLGNS